MSKKIDQQVVEMRFDNAKFEKNIQTSISSLDKLKQSLNLDGVSKGLDDVDASSKNCATGLSGLSSGIEVAAKKFSALEVMAITALANITNSAVNAGKRLVSALTIDQIVAGFGKYEEKTTAVQTILNATGKSMEEVNEQLEKLNWFTDETSYNFTDMVSNIGKFTSNGVDLEVAVTAMMGIANWAALSGQNAEAASRAMYNLSQAIGIGSVKLQDWKSIENANMATKEFKEIVIETAKALGTLDEYGETETGTLVDASNFSSTLSDGWFTSDVLLKALDKYGNYSEEVYKVATDQGLTAADAMKIVSSETMELGSKAFKAAQEAKTFSDAINATKDAVSSGWSNTFEIIFGNYEEAKVLWTDLANELYDIFAASAEGRNELLSEWKELGGRDLMIESLMNALAILKDVIAAVSEAFHDIFPPMTAEKLVEITQSVRDFTEKLKTNEGLLNNIKRVLRGFFAILDIGKQLLSAIFRILQPLFNKLLGVGNGFLDLSGSLGDFIVRLSTTIKESDTFYKIFTKIANVISKVIAYFANLIKKLKETEVFSKVSEIFSKALGSIKKFVRNAKEKFTTPGFEFLHALLEKLLNVLVKIGSIVTKVAMFFINAFSLMTKAISGSTLIAVLSKLWEIIVVIGKGLFEVLGKAISYIADKIANADFKGLLDMLSALATGGIAVGIWKLVDTIRNAFSGLPEIVDGIKGILDSVRGCFEAYQNKLKADTLFKIASAVAILVASLVVLSFIDADKIATGVVALALLLTELVIAMKSLSGISKDMGKATKTTVMLLGMSISVLVLASALKKLASLDVGGLIKGLAGVAGIVGIIVAATKVLAKDSGKVMKGALQLILFATAIKILASACTSLSKLSWGELSKGLVGVGVLMAEVALFLNVAKFSKRAFSTALGMILLASAIKILASAAKTFGQMNWTQISKGLIGIAGILGELVIFSKLVKPTKMVSTGLGLIAIGAAMKIFSSAMRSMSSLSWEGIAKGIISMASCLAMVVLVLNLLPKGIITKGLGLITVATSLTIFAAALNKMGDRSWGSVAKSLVTLGGAIAILAVGLNLMKGTVGGSAALLVAAIAIGLLTPALVTLGAMSWEGILKSLLTLAGVFAILGVAGLVLGPLVPVILGLAGALALIGVAVLAAGVGLTAAGIGLTAIATGFTALTSAIATGAVSLVAGLKAIIQGISGMIITVATMIARGIIEFVRVIGEGAPVIFETVTTIVLGLIEVLLACVPRLVECVFSLLTSVLTTLWERTPEIIEAVVGILLGCLRGLAENMYLIVQAAVDIVLGFINGIAQKLPDIIQAGFNMVISFLNGIADALDNNTQLLIDAVKRVCKSVLNAIITWFKDSISSIIEIGKNIINGIIEGIKNMWNKLKESVVNTANKVANWFKDILGIHSPSRVFAGFGMNIDEGLAQGITKYTGLVEDATSEVGDAAIDTMADAIADISDVIENGEFGEPTIRPVMDLTEIQNGAYQLSRMMDDANNYSMSASVDLAGHAARSMKTRSITDEKSALDDLTKSIKDLADNPAQQNNNTFYISGSNDPEEIAEIVSRKIAMGAVRKRKTWE